MPKDRKKRTSIRRTVNPKSARRAIRKQKVNTVARKPSPKFELRGGLRPMSSDGTVVDIGHLSRQLKIETADTSRKHASVVVPYKDRPDEEPDASKFISAVLDHAAEVIGNKDKAMRWMGSPIRALAFATPISLLGTKKGAERVNRVLGQMEHGIW